MLGKCSVDLAAGQSEQWGAAIKRGEHRNPAGIAPSHNSSPVHLSIHPEMTEGKGERERWLQKKERIMEREGGREGTRERV